MHHGSSTATSSSCRHSEFLSPSTKEPNEAQPPRTLPLPFASACPPPAHELPCVALPRTVLESSSAPPPPHTASHDQWPHSGEAGVSCAGQGKLGVFGEDGALVSSAKSSRNSSKLMAPLPVWSSSLTISWAANSSMVGSPNRELNSLNEDAVMLCSPRASSSASALRRVTWSGRNRSKSSHPKAQT